MNLVIDIGNTRIKWAVFEGVQMKDTGTTEEFDWVISKLNEVDHGIVSSVRDVEIPDAICRKALVMDHSTPIPISLAYDTPETLGLDRIAGVTGLLDEFADTNCLLVDLGTCITYDLLTKGGEFQGGAIAPGLQMRLQCMHTYTGKLPEVSVQTREVLKYPAKSTKESMKTGAVIGIWHEINGYISQLQKDFSDLHVILTGGDASYFESKIKAPIFVRPEIILIGLNRILLYNETNA
jgi:type III pantothenate kinase